ncbi:glutamate receptor 1-like [Haliotis rufescens]|uniref:glutamate receptor 1-like n=1 Tax=Haliotis rufescens TaxID=6454 RepID=UPI00201E7C4C|nr:glutamate receptor 1-like [Haliotis rufescens]
MNSTGTVYNVTAVLSNPYVMKKHGGGYKGFLVDLLNKISEQAGFKYNIQLAKDGNYGSLVDGRWNGMIGEVVRGEADIGLGDITITTMRERYVDFSKPYLSQSLRLLGKKPVRYYPGLGTLLEPFTVELWLSILIALLLVAILFVVIGRFNPFEWRQVASDKDPRGARHSFGLRESFMFVFSTITLQGYRETPRSLAGRVLAVSWFIFVFFTVVAYIGASTAFMLAGGKLATSPPGDLEDIVNDRTVQVGMVRGGSSFQTFRTSTIDIYNRLADYVEMQDSFVSTAEEGLERVRGGGGDFVMLMESLRADYIAQQLPCDVMAYGKGHFSMGLSLITKHGSGLKREINAALLRLKEDGIIGKMQQKWWTLMGRCPVARVANKQQPTIMAVRVGARRLAAPFLLLLIGAILAVVVLVGEIVFRKLRQ